MSYLDTILEKSNDYLMKSLNRKEYTLLLKKVEKLKDKGIQEIVEGFCDIYYQFQKERRQAKYKNSNKELNKLISKNKRKAKLIWGDCLSVLKQMDSESIDLMVTSPPYYNARDYSQWKNLEEYLQDMKKIIKESYRVLDNHKAWVFNVGDITGNDNMYTKSVWGARRIPLGSYFIAIFEECGFRFIDDFIWDKGEVESQRHKNGDTPYPFYQYPLNCYEHIMIFYKHEQDETRYPCPVCGCLKVNGNAYAGVGIKSWECKNLDCFERSKANRGKRFSARSVMMNDLKMKENYIDKEFVKKWRRDIVRINPVIKINNKGDNVLGHTAPFPFEIPEFAIKMFTGIGDKVLDPFAGSCTSLIQAQKMARIGIGVELNRGMFESSIKKNIDKHIGISNLEEYLCLKKKIKKELSACMEK